MVDPATQETKNLRNEFKWVLKAEVHLILKKLHAILIDCVDRFPLPLNESEREKRTEKYVLSVQPDQLQATLTLKGDNITHAEITFKSSKTSQHIQRTTITEDSPWKLQQIQDAVNHLQQAIKHIDDIDGIYSFKTSNEVLRIIENIWEALKKGRESLVIPKKKSIDDLINGRNMKSLSPNLAGDVAISFYLQSQKLILALYQLNNVHGTMTFNSLQAEVTLQWLNEVLLLLSSGLHLCQQLRDKISVFSVYKGNSFEFNQHNIL